MTRDTDTLDLQGWLQRLETLHPSTIELGLDRVRAVYERLALDLAPLRIVTVGGTNGKGSTVAMLAAVLRQAGHRVGTYTSPHLLRYNERVCLDGRECSDADLCTAFAAVEAVRGGISLTYFEFGTLAALWWFAREQPAYLILEVGLGGRLDAVNIVDSTLSILTNVALDHVDWLGNTREQIGFEKAGIFRAGCPALYGERDMPASVREQGKALGAKLLQQGRDYGWQDGEGGWSWQGLDGNGRALRLQQLPALPYPLDNAASVLQALYLLEPGLSESVLRQGLIQTRLAGRCQEITYQGRRVLLDVAHNPHAAACLAQVLRSRLEGAPVRLVIAMLGDKDSAGVMALLAPVASALHVASLGGERGADAKIIYNYALQHGVANPVRHDTVWEAFTAACEAAAPDEVVVVTGSFFTVAAVLEHI